MPLPRLYLPGQAADEMGLPVAALDAAMAAGVLPWLEIGGQRYLTADLIGTWLARVTRGPITESTACPAHAQAGAVPVPVPGLSNCPDGPAGTSAGPMRAAPRSAQQVVDQARTLAGRSSGSTRSAVKSRRKKTPPPDPRQIVMPFIRD